MNHQGLHWNVHCVANVALRIGLNLYKRGFKIYDLLVISESSFTAEKNCHLTLSEPNLKVGLELVPFEKTWNLRTMFSTSFKIFIYIST